MHILKFKKFPSRNCQTWETKKEFVLKNKEEMKRLTRICMTLWKLWLLIDANAVLSAI
jgi:hypothetical protein